MARILSGVATYPNLVTGVRLLLVPLFGLFLKHERWAFGLWLCLLLVATDALDGFLARRLGQRSEVGSYLDPLADKLLVLVGFSMLSTKGHVPAWLLVLVLSRDGLILIGVGIYLLAKGKPMEASPTRLGKATAVTQFLFILYCLWVLEADLSGNTMDPLTWVVAAFTVGSFVQYGCIFLRSFYERPEPDAVS
jgi:cardiolipin synthase